MHTLEDEITAQRQREQEKTDMLERARIVALENLAAIASGDFPPEIRLQAASIILNQFNSY